MVQWINKGSIVAKSELLTTSFYEQRFIWHTKAVFTLETDDPSETVNPSSKPVSDGTSVSSVNTANGCDTRTKLS